MANANLAFSKETLLHLAELSELTKQPAQELAEKFIQEVIENEEDMAIAKLAIQRNT